MCKIGEIHKTDDMSDVERKVKDIGRCLVLHERLGDEVIHRCGSTGEKQGFF